MTRRPHGGGKEGRKKEVDHQQIYSLIYAFTCPTDGGKHKQRTSVFSRMLIFTILLLVVNRNFAVAICLLAGLMITKFSESNIHNSHLQIDTGGIVMLNVADGSDTVANADMLSVWLEN